MNERDWADQEGGVASLQSAEAVATMADDALDRHGLDLWIRDRDEAVLQALITRYRPMVSRVCMRILRDPAAAEDAIQETFIGVANMTTRISGSLGAWLHACAVNAARQRRRSDQRRVQREAQAPSRHEVAASEMEGLVDECVELLSEADRELLVQYFYLDHTQAEIAATLGMSHVAVHKRLRGVLGRLHDLLRRRGVRGGRVLLLALLFAGGGRSATQAAQAAADLGVAATASTIRVTAGLIAGTVVLATLAAVGWSGAGQEWGWAPDQTAATSVQGGATSSTTDPARGAPMPQATEGGRTVAGLPEHRSVRVALPSGGMIPGGVELDITGLRLLVEKAPQPQSRVVDPETMQTVAVGWENRIRRERIDFLGATVQGLTVEGRQDSPIYLLIKPAAGQPPNHCAEFWFRHQRIWVHKKFRQAVVLVDGQPTIFTYQDNFDAKGLLLPGIRERSHEQEPFATGKFTGFIMAIRVPITLARVQMATMTWSEVEDVVAEIAGSGTVARIRPYSFTADPVVAPSEPW